LKNKNKTFNSELFCSEFTEIHGFIFRACFYAENLGLARTDPMAPAFNGNWFDHEKWVLHIRTE